MTLWPLHMLSGLFGLVATVAVGQTVDAGQRGVAGARAFADMCLKTAPSFAAPSIEENSLVGRGEPLGGVNVFAGEKFFQAANGRCYCGTRNLIAEQWIQTAANNTVAVIKTLFPSQVRSQSEEPVAVGLEFEGVDVRVEVKAAQVRGTIWMWIPLASRDGECPA